MNVAAVVTDAVDRVSGIVHAVTTDLDAEGLSFRPDDSSNSIAWLLWHTARVQDDHIASITGNEQVNTISLCSGGITTTALLGHLASTHETLIHCATLAVTLLDFSVPSMIGTFGP